MLVKAMDLPLESVPVGFDNSCCCILYAFETSRRQLETVGSEELSLAMKTY